ncbi:MAG: DUF4126 domain-containing protein [Coriobacteriia bacterium]
MEFLTGIGLAAPAGLNAYIPILAVGLAQRFGLLELAEPWDLLGEWWVIALAGVLFLVEVVADKVPAADSVNDIVQTVVRPAAGGIVFVAASSEAVDVHPALLVAAGVILAGAVHAAKATARPAVNATTAGFGAPAVSTAEDIIAAATSLAAVILPIAVAAGLVAIAGFLVWLRVRRSRQRSAA